MVIKRKNKAKLTPLVGGKGKDTLVGKAGSDILDGKAGDDRLYADTPISVAQAISNGNNQAGSGQQGDWLKGDWLSGEADDAYNYDLMGRAA